MVEVVLSSAESHDQSKEEQPTETKETSYDEIHNVSSNFHIIPPRGQPFDGFMNPFDVLHEKDVEEVSVEEEDPSKLVLPIADLQGNPLPFPGQEEKQKIAYLRNFDIDAAFKDAPGSVIIAASEVFKYLYSSGLLILSVVLLMAALFSEQTIFTEEKGLSPVFGFFVFWAMIAWLATMEAGQGCLVGLQPIDNTKYAETHPRTCDNTYLCHREHNMYRFTIGRQFLVVLVIYFLNLLFATIPDVDVLGLNSVMVAAFLKSGAALVIITIVIGQLVTQNSAASHMLDFLNNYFMLYFVTYISLATELSGILHSAHLFRILLSKLASGPAEVQYATQNAAQKVFFWGRGIASLLALSFSCAVTIKAFFTGNTTAWEGINSVASLVLFLMLTCIVGVFEGLQYAVFAVINLPGTELDSHSVASKNTQLAFTGQNLQVFLIGRQILVSVGMFALAKITTLNVEIGVEPNIFGVPDWVQRIFNTGFGGALITTIGASLVGRVFASSFPVTFLSNPLASPAIHLCLIVERAGIASVSFVISKYFKKMFRSDQVYLDGTEVKASTPITQRDNDIDCLTSTVRFSCSLGLLVFSVVMLMASVFTEQTSSTKIVGLPSTAVFFLFWVLILIMFILEGGQGCLLGLRPIDKQFYDESHPKTSNLTKLLHTGNNMERFVLGREFLCLTCIFLLNFLASAVEGVSVLGLPEVVNKIFLGTGIALMLTTIVLAQLTAQVSAACTLLDFTNSWFIFIIACFSLVVEFSGILHSVYLIQMLVESISGKSGDTIEVQRTRLQRFFFWIRVLLSLALLSYSITITFSALIDGKTNMYGSVSPGVTVVIFLALLCIVGMLEGLQVALFGALNLPEDGLKKSSVVYKNCQMAFTAQNLQAILVGRQICLTICLFVIARTITPNVEVGVGDNILGVQNWVQKFFNTGLLGALVITILASFGWRVVASKWPFQFLANPLIYFIIRFCMLLEVSGLCSAGWVLGRNIKTLLGLQPDSVYFEGADKAGTEPVTQREKEVDITIGVIKYCYSAALIFFCLIIVIASIFTDQTQIAEAVHPGFALFVIVLALVWIAMIEGGQESLVGLQPVEEELYVDSHPIAFKSTKISLKGNNMERFLCGRQFLLFLLLYVAHLAAAALPGSSVLGLSDTLNLLFVESRVALVLLITVVAQLVGQINAADCELDFISTYLMVLSTYVSLGIEYSGLLHSVYLVQLIFSKVAGISMESKEPPRNGAQNLFFWGRTIFSVFVLAFAFSVTISALVNGNTTMWERVPIWASVTIWILLLCVVGLLDGIQIAVFAVVNLPEEELLPYDSAKTTCELIFSRQNLPAFLIGRQFLVSIGMVVISQITTVDIEAGKENNILAVPDALQKLLPLFITTIFGSAIWRIMASNFPISFLSNRIVYFATRCCLLFDASGILSSAWLVALVHKQVFGLQRDEFYIGTYMDNKVLTDSEHHSQSGHSISEGDDASPVPDPISDLKSASF